MAYEVITLNLIPSGEVPVIHAAQYDVDRPLKFALKLGEDDFNPSGYSLELQIRKVDNNIVTAEPSDVTNNVVTFNSTEQMCACSGTNLGEIQITKDDLDIATLHFYLVIQRDVLAGGLTSQSEIHDLEDQIAEIVPEVIGDEYYTAAEVDEKIAEIPTFDPENYYDKTQLYTKTETNGLLSQKANINSLAAVATSGSYNDLINKPNIPDVSDYYTKSETYSQNEVNTLLNTKADTSSLAAVATSGSYNDLTNKPTIPAAQVNSDWNSSSGVSEILNKPSLAAVATSGSYNDLTDKPTIPTNAELLPIQSGSATNTKDYIDGRTASDIEYSSGFTVKDKIDSKADTSNYPNFTKILSVATSDTTIRFIVNHNSDSAFSIFVMLLGGTLLYLGKASSDSYASYNTVCGSINAHSEDSTHVYLNVGNYKRATFIITSNDATGLGNISITTS